jgi:chromosome segregation protein
MRLRSIVVSGFKTFASRSEVLFDRGITAIVGPNGSGKSNLVDALRWGLGETNARELRGQRMDEVIYAGGGDRPRMGVASVELTIDNQEGKLPVDDPEVSVSRRVVRGEGDTEYRLNGRRVRLRDVERLLGGTGLTQNGYAVVVQNDIDGIIEATPAQRRALVEEAAGVRTLRAACEDALHRISQAEQTLLRIEDLLADAEPRLTELAEQTAAAREQRAMAERLAELRGSLAREQWRSARGRLKQAQRRLGMAADRLAAAREAEAGFSARAVAQRARLDAAREARDAALADVENARLNAERASGDARRWSDRLASAGLQRAAAAAEASALLAEVMEAEAALRQLTAVPAEPRSWSSLDDRAGALRRAAAEADDQARHAEQAMRAAADAAAAAGAALTQADAAMRKHDAEVRLYEETLEGLSADAAADAERIEELSRDAAAKQQAAATAAAGAESADAAVTLARDAAERARNAAAAAGRRADSATSQAREAMARAATARGLLAGLVGGEGGVAHAVAGGRVQGRRLSECVSVRDGTDAAAVAAALEGQLGAWLVADVEDAARHLDPALPREQLLAAEVTEVTSSVPAPYRSALSAIDITAEARGAVSRLLQGVWLAPDLAAARAAVGGDARAAVLPDGTVITAAGLRGGGSPAEPLAMVDQERQAEEARERAAEVERQALAVAAESRQVLSDAEAALTAAMDESASARLVAAAARSASAGVEALIDAARDRVQRTQPAVEARRQDLAVARRDGARAVEARRGAEAAFAAAREQLASATAVRDTERETADAAETLARAAELELGRARAEGADSEDRRDALRRALDSARGRLDAAEARVLSSEFDAIAALVRRRTAGDALAAAQQDVAWARAGLESSLQPLGELERLVVALEAEHAEVAVTVARAEDEQSASSAEVETAEAELAEIAETVRDEGEEEGVDFDPAAAERAEREIVRLERRIGALGPVNALAPEQYEALSERVSSLQEHRGDLRAACADVISMARRLEVEVEKRFDAVFSAVSYHFQQIFGELFPGGRASLRLEEVLPAEAEEEELEEIAGRRPGVEILAQPPGKRLGPLRLLSGGERSLTALAVVLALQQVNPSPFYVFDEVDAALDDSNVLRFTRLLRRLADDQQFIVVTHNHITMAAADALWGVTIDQDGTSSVIGVRFEPDTMAGETVTVRLRRAARAAS